MTKYVREFDKFSFIFELQLPQARIFCILSDFTYLFIFKKFHLNYPLSEISTSHSLLPYTHNSLKFLTRNTHLPYFMEEYTRRKRRTPEIGLNKLKKIAV